MMKILIVILAALALIVSAGCAAAPAETTAKPATKPVPQTTVPTTQAPTTVPVTTVPETTAPFAELTLVDDENCTVIIKGYDEEALLGFGVNVFLENKTDKELMFSIGEVSVNGYMCDPFWAATVSAGKKANEQIIFFESDLEANGIEIVEEITFTLNVYDSDDWLAEYLVKEVFTVNP